MLTRREACKQVAGVAAAATFGTVMAPNATMATPSQTSSSASPEMPDETLAIWDSLDPGEKIGFAIEMANMLAMSPQQARELFLASSPGYRAERAIKAYRARLISKEEARNFILEGVKNKLMRPYMKMAILMETIRYSVFSEREVYQLAGIPGSPQTNLV